MGTTTSVTGTTIAEATVGVTPGPAPDGEPRTPEGVPEDVPEESEVAPELVPKVVWEEAPAKGPMITVCTAAASPPSCGA
jgi:hypothetical protein